MRYLYLCVLMIMGAVVHAQDFPFRSLTPAYDVSPSEEAQCMFFDKEGIMWLGTNAGLKSYDGYTFKTYRSNAYSPGILPNNTVYCITEDNRNNLWLGTRNGLVRMNKLTGAFKTFHLPSEVQRIIYTLYTSRDGTVWIGTDGGLSFFDPKSETFHTYDSSNTTLIDSDGKKSRLVYYSAKSIIEDRNGDMLVGSWSSGLMRFRRGTHVFYRYPQLNKRNSAFSLYFDRNHRLWVGSWAYGAIRMDNPDNVANPQMHHYPFQPNYFDTFYRFVEDPVTQTLWACTREGVCVLREKGADAQWDCYTKINGTDLNYCKDLATDRMGNLWICTQNEGVRQINTNPSPFKAWDLGVESGNMSLNYVNSVYTADGTWVWMGLNPYGIALYNRTTGATLYNNDIPQLKDFPSKPLTTSVSSICPRSNGELWFATNNYGIIVMSQGKPTRLINNEVYPYIVDNYVNVLYETRDRTMWLGQRCALSVYYPNNQGIRLQMKEGRNDISASDVRGITQDRKGNVWISTDNQGIIRISGSPRRLSSLRYHQYNARSGNYPLDDALNCLEDSHGRLWAISNSGGLFLYDKETDAFVPKNREYHIRGDRALAISEDHLGNLWITTDVSLVRMRWDKHTSDVPEVTYFTKEDGLGDILFTPNSTNKFGRELLFGTKRGFFSFVPTADMGKNNAKKLRFVVTDILIDDMPFADLDSAERRAVSEVMPSFTKAITIPSHVKKFTIEFALLTYGNARRNVYAYKLDGYDSEWQYCAGNTHRATFQNLPTGRYTLHLKATDSYGHWQELPYTIKIRVSPPWYATWWAYQIYIILLVVAVLCTVRWYKAHLKTRNRLQMGIILTNITHELLTPLTVISACIYKLRDQAPQYEEDYSLMQNNISRTTRLLRQILEVRKSQAGQLKLLVSKGDLAAFVRMACENIRPMTLHGSIELAVNIPQEDIPAWFDADKLDKIVYNLLSNAIKYNKENGSVTVSLTATREYATIIVADTGIGMSKEKRKNLYTRFLDGDYRKANVSGTGIGMSLTHDLVTLHHGHIECQSEEGKGTTFTVSIPIRKGAYGPGEIDVTNQKAWKENQVIKDAASEAAAGETATAGGATHQPFVRKDSSRILIVEDNEELLALMQRVLSKNYQVLTARNGKQAWGIIQRKELDLVVSDVMMPIMDGIELTQKIKDDKAFWQLPVILLTAKNRDEDKNEGYATGADAYVCKPFKLEDLQIRINTLIANRRKIQKTFAAQESTPLPKKNGESHYSNPDDTFMRQVAEMVKKHLSDTDYGREQLASDMMISVSTFYNKVKAITGQPPTDFILKIRLQEARRIIEENPDVLVADVAYRVGFGTPKYFSRLFKKEYGMTPTEFADRQKNGPQEA